MPQATRALAARTPPDLTLRFTAEADGSLLPAGIMRNDAATLKAEQAYLTRPIALSQTVQAFAADPVDLEAAATWPDGHLNALRSAAAITIMAVYDLVEAHEAALTGQPRLRRVQ